MPAVVIAIGNPLRRDDGAAHQAYLPAGIEKLAVLQLTPEIALQIAPYDLVIFIDADIAATEVRTERIEAVPMPPPLTHVFRPAEVVALARSLFGFTGDAYTCHIPIEDISPGEGLTSRTRRFAEQAAREIYKISQSYENPRTHSADCLARVGSAR